MREARHRAGLTQATVACRAGLAERSLRRLEAGHRRTRLSTLTRLAHSLDAPDPDALLADLVTAVGAALAPESQFAERVARRRDARRRQAARAPVTEHRVVYEQRADGTLAVHTHLRRTSRSAMRAHRYAVLHRHDGKQERIASTAAWT